MTVEQHDGLIEVGPESHEAIIVNVPDCHIAFGPIPLFLQLLHRDNALVEGVPNIDVCGLGFLFATFA